MSEREQLLAVLRAALPDLQRQWPIRSLAVFGSVARDEAKPTSDLDILVEFARPVALSVFLALEDRLARLTDRRVELVSRAALKPYVGRHVLREAIRL
jgi:predicted nucleotidyltransferase